jgi:uncharacterized protein YdaU (DUF1376 family)
MKTELKEFIDSQDEDLQLTLHQYYDLYLKLRANGNEDKASVDVLAFFQRNQGELDHKVDHEIDKMENDNFIIARGKKRKRKRTNKSKKSKKSRRAKRTKRR